MDKEQNGPKAALLALTLLLTVPLFAAAAGVSERPQLVGDELVWQIEGEHGTASLRLVRPDGRILEQTVGVQASEVDLHIPEPEALPDGVYAWEITLAPRLDEAERAALAEARAQSTRPVLDGRPQGFRAQGSFRVAGGAFFGLAGDRPKNGARLERAGGNVVTPQAAPITGNLTVRENLCVGADCADNESFGSDVIRMRADNLRIAFLDASTIAGYPSGDWQLRTNESTQGGADQFSIDWLGTSSSGSVGDSPLSMPFVIEGAAPDHAIHIDSTGAVGLGTSTPLEEIHVRSGDSPTLRLEQDESSGFRAQTWNLVGNESSFFVQDGNSSTIPFEIEPGADSRSLVVSDNNNIGIGTTNPVARLHVEGDARIEGALYQLSSRSAKSAFDAPDPARLLAQVEQLDLGFWSYTNDAEGTRHFGPAAEDFHAVFGLGEDERHISVADMAGIALGATQALRAELRQRDATIAELTRRLERLEASLDAAATQ